MDKVSKNFLKFSPVPIKTQSQPQSTSDSTISLVADLIDNEYYCLWDKYSDTKFDKRSVTESMTRLPDDVLLSLVFIIEHLTELFFRLAVVIEAIKLNRSSTRHKID